MRPLDDEYEADFGPDWAERQEDWRRKLGRLRLGAEPLEFQLARYRRVTWGLTAVSLVIATVFVAIFTAFGRPDVGGSVAAILLLPVVSYAWLDYRLLGATAAAYEAD